MKKYKPRKCEKCARIFSQCSCEFDRARKKELTEEKRKAKKFNATAKLKQAHVIKSVCPTCDGKGIWEEYEIGVLTCNVCKGTGQTVL